MTMQNSKTALITGCGGFSGRHLINELSRLRGVQVVGASLSGRPMPGSMSIHSAQLDIRNQNQVDQLVAQVRPQMVFHIAALFEGSTEDLYRTNFLGTLYLLNALRRHAPDARILLVGSAAEYGSVPAQDMPITEKYACIPQTDYAASKYAATLLGREYVHRFGLKIVIARPFNIVGAGMPDNLLGGAILHRARQALVTGDTVVKVGNMQSARDFVAVEDVVQAYVKMILGDFWGETFNLCSGSGTPVSTLAGILLSCSDRSLRLETDPSLHRAVDPSSVYGSYAKAKSAFGFKPVIPLEESLKAAWRFAMEEATPCV